MEIRADLPAVVLAIEVQVGTEVQEGDSLVLLESMKLEIPMEAPRSGRVTAVHVAVGETVHDGQLLVEIVE